MSLVNENSSFEQKPSQQGGSESISTSMKAVDETEQWIVLGAGGCLPAYLLNK